MTTTKEEMNRRMEEILEEDLDELFGPFDAEDLGNALLSALEATWNDIPNVTRAIMMHVAIELKRHYANVVKAQDIDCARG